MDERLYSRPLDVHRISEYPEVQGVIDHLLSELEASVLIKNSPRKKIRKHLKVVVLDLYIAYLSDPLLYVAYSRSKGNYSKETRLGQLFFGFRPMMRVIDGLEALGYLENHKGFQDRSTGRGRQARMRATERLLDLIQNHSVTPFMVEREDGEVIVLRDRDKENLPYEDTEEISLIREQLVSYNTFIRKHTIGLSLPVEAVRQILVARKIKAIDYTRTQLKRVFNENFSRGGRFYQGWWQEIPSNLRRYITIDDQPTSELDYGGQHLLLLYALNEDEYSWLRGDTDPYGEKNRDLMKQVFLICVNEESREKAIQAIRQEINFNHPALTSTNVFINSLIDTTKEKHPELSGYFFSGMWAELQHQDSEIAEYVLNHMRANRLLVLPVHDSFVVQDQYIHNLYSIMKEAYRILVGHSIPEIKLKMGANTDLTQPSFL